MQNTDPKYLERYANVYTLTMSIPDDIRFDMHYWGRQHSESPCGTAACMAGHAGLHPWFRKQGLILEPSAKDPGFLSPPGKSYCDAFDEIADFFGYDCEKMYNHPFDPNGSWYYEFNENGEQVLDYYNELIQLFDGKRITPSIAAEALRNYMLSHWDTEFVNTAIEKAEARYNVDFVHQFAKWE